MGKNVCLGIRMQGFLKRKSIIGISSRPRHGTPPLRPLCVIGILLFFTKSRFILRKMYRLSRVSKIMAIMDIVDLFGSVSMSVIIVC